MCGVGITIYIIILFMIKIFKTMKDYLEKIEQKCRENNITFIGFANENNEYKNNKTKLILKCNKCGYVWNTTSYDKFIMRPSKCPVCSKKYHYTKDEYIKLIKNKCSQLEYEFNGFVNKQITKNTKLKLKCKKCGYEWETTTINNFLRNDRKSHKCGRNNVNSKSNLLEEEKVIEKIKNKLINSNLDFISFREGKYIGRNKSHIILYCKKCGSLNDVSLQHLLYNKNIKCKKCEFNGKLENETAIHNITEKCKLLNYDFLGFNNESNQYDGKRTKLILKCNKCGRIWKSTSYSNFMNSTIKCVGCIRSWKLEKEIKYILDKHNIKYEEQKTFEWLTYNDKLFLDFFLPEYNIFIECQGRQHFMSVDAFGGKNGFDLTIKRDKAKYSKCLSMGIKPIYYSTTKWKAFLNEKIIHNEEELINKIKNG